MPRNSRSGSSRRLPKPAQSAHQGVLFLDQLLEFPRAVVEALRQALEDRTVTVSKAAMPRTLPANFSLVASMNPCPYGFN